MLIYGLNPVLEALRAGQVQRLRVARRADVRLEGVLRLAADRRVPVERVETAVLDRATRGAAHQGVMAEASLARDYSIEELVATGPTPLLVVLDGIEDPQNFGAILRTADAAGVSGVIQQTRHAARLGPAAAKASAGAIAHARIARVVNIARALDELQELGVSTVGLAAGAPVGYDEIDLTVPTALVVGAEGTGLRRLVRERCDRLVGIPMHGHVASLNVSVATGIALFEALRQRAAGSRSTP